MVVSLLKIPYIYRVGQNRIYIPYMTVYMVISLPKYRICTVYIWLWPTLRIYTVCTYMYVGIGVRL